MSHDSVIWQMVRKDLRLNRTLIVFTIVFGGAALSTLLLRREPTTVVGVVMLFIVLIFTGCMLPTVNILNERKKQTLPFMMSLPVSSTQYTTAKLLGTVGMFLIPWLTLAIGATWLIVIQGVLPHGTIPMALILLLLPFVGLTVITAMTLVGETEAWSIAGNVICNSSYGLGWYFIARTRSLMVDLTSKAPVWNRAEVTFLTSELSTIVLILALTYYLQSRKRDFV